MKLAELQALLPPFILRLQNAARAFEEGPGSPSVQQYVVEHGLTTVAGELAKTLTGGVRTGKRIARDWIEQQEEGRRAKWERGIRHVPLLIAAEIQSALATGLDDVIEKKINQWCRALSDIRSSPKSMRTGTVIQRCRLLLGQMMRAMPRIVTAVAAPKSTRDEFSAATKRKLGSRVGLRCSNPGCRVCTSGPAMEEDGLVHVGVAAHISAAARRGPRFNVELTSNARSSAANGIYLCQICGKMVDDDRLRYPEELLQEWKDDAEEEQRLRLGRTAAHTAGSGRLKLGWQVNGQMLTSLRACCAQRVSLVLDVPEQLTNLRWRLGLDERLRASPGTPSARQQDVQITAREAVGWIGHAPRGIMVLRDVLAIDPVEAFQDDLPYVLQADQFEEPCSGVLRVRAT